MVKSISWLLNFQNCIHLCLILSDTSTRGRCIVRLRYFKIYLYKFMRSLKRLDSIKNRLVFKSLDLKGYLFSEISSRFAKVRVAFEFKFFFDTNFSASCQNVFIEDAKCPKIVFCIWFWIWISQWKIQNFLTLIILIYYIY